MENNYQILEFADPKQRTSILYRKQIPGLMIGYLDGNDAQIITNNVTFDLEAILKFKNKIITIGLTGLNSNYYDFFDCRINKLTATEISFTYSTATHS